MNMSEPTQYLRVVGMSPHTRMVCAMPSCDNRFVAKDGVAFEGTNSNEGGGVSIYLFCGYECYLGGLPLKCCGRA